MIQKNPPLIDFQNQISQQLPMNLSYKQSGDFQNVMEWIQQFPYPNCKKVNNLASLRNGVAIAQVMIDKLPPAMHPLFLPNIEIYNINPQRSIMNLKVLLNTLKTYYANHEELHDLIEEFNAQGLYFDHNMMETFIHTILMPLQNASIAAPSDQIMRQGYLGVEQISDIANLSSIIMHNDPKPQQIMPKKPISDQKEIQQQRENAQMIKIKKWLLQSHHIDANEHDPDQIIGKLVNSIFAGSRLDHNLIVKQSHYELGSIAVFKKVCDYLLECERMPKQNVLTLMQEVQEGSIREEVFWGVIEDLMNLKISHNLKTSQSSRKKSISKTPDEFNTNKENNPKECINAAKTKQPPKQKVTNIVQYTSQIIRKAETWIKNDLGYEFSLNKSKSTDKMEQNPLLNGVLLGSVIMRMQIGKVNTIKEPKNKKDIEKNLNEVVNSVIRRGIESGRKFSTLKPTYQNFLGILWDIKMECQKKAQIEKIKRLEMYRIKKGSSRQIGETQIQSLSEWLKEKGIELQNYPYLPTSKISEFCGQILELRLLRQTTNRIKQINMTKILQQLRRVGWQYDCTCQQVMEVQGNNIRWNILKFTRQLLKYKVYYYR